jgi:hypothetical protein
MPVDPVPPRHEEPETKSEEGEGPLARWRRSREAADEDQHKYCDHHPERPATRAVAWPCRPRVHGKANGEHQRLERDREWDRAPGAETDADARPGSEREIGAMHRQIEKPMAHDRGPDHPRPAPVAPNGIVRDAEQHPPPDGADEAVRDRVGDEMSEDYRPSSKYGATGSRWRALAIANAGGISDSS